MTPADVLDAMADHLERDGWRQGEMHGKDGSHCLLGAAEKVFLHGPRSVAVRRFAEWLSLDDGGDPPAFAVADWNDDAHRTAEQVVKELRACAADLRDAQ